jgi:hypothetical protein
LGGEAHFALAIEWRLWRGLRPFPRRPHKSETFHLLRHSRLGIPGEAGVDSGDIFYSLRIARSRPVDLQAEAYQSAARHA